MKGSSVATIICLAISFLPYMAISIPTTSKNDHGTFQFNYIGSADGKSFFADKSTSLTWMEARSLCTSTGMHLASITSAAQQTVLANASNTTAFTGNFWTGGRDAQSHSQFVWDFNIGPVNASSAGVINSYQSIQTCLHYVATASHLHLHSTLCTTKQGVLCEIIT